MIKRVENIIKLDVRSFFEDYLKLMTEHRQLISGYYINGDVYPKTSFDLFADIKNRGKLILLKIRNNRNFLLNYSDFEVVDKIEEIVHNLETLENYSRWLRASIYKGQFKQNTEIDLILRQNQSIDSSFSETDSMDTVLRNKLKETDFDLNGGTKFRFSYKQGELLLNSIVDNLTGNNLLGKDIFQKIVFESNDLKVLSPEQTFEQSCYILISLLKKDNPQFPELGFDKNSISNINVMNVMLPSIIRQLYSLVSTDDSIASFNIDGIEMNGDKLTINVTFSSYINNQVKQKINGN